MNTNVNSSFQENIEKQYRAFDEILRRSKNPFNDLGGFIAHYNHVRASLLSLMQNPDTKDDPDFINLCNTWTKGKDYFFNGRMRDFCLEFWRQYDQLKRKPQFTGNIIFEEMAGHFKKSIAQIFSDDYYCPGFFRLDDID